VRCPRNLRVAGNLTIDKVIPLTVSDKDKEYDRSAPKFIKRLRPGKELPADFQLSHTLYPTLEGHYVYVESWNSGHVVKIDTSTGEVVKVASKADVGWQMPHGAFIPGTIR
jgi:hypothetical protein